MELNCLDYSKPKTQEWLDNTSKEELYKAYVENKGIIPDYETYSKSKLSKNEVRQMLDNILPKDYPVKELADLMYSLPSDTLAAYYKNVIYLSSNPSKQEVYEEGFHAIFDSFLTPAEKKQSLSIGQAILANRLKKDNNTIDQYVKNLIEKNPTIYGVLSKKDAFNRAYEEEIASLYVDYSQDNPKNELFAVRALQQKIYSLTGIDNSLIASVLSKLFAFFRKLFNTYTSNQDTLEMLFQNINRGKYKNQFHNGENSVSISPATRLLELTKEDKIYFDDLLEEDVTQKGTSYTFSSAITQQTVRNIGAIYFQLIHNQIFKTKDEYFNEAIAQYFSLDETYSEFFEIKDDKAIISSKNINAVQELKEEIESYVRLFDGLINLEQDENVFSNYDKSANENDPFETSYSSALKQRIGKTGAIKKTKYVDYNGDIITINQIQSVDVLRVYYSLIRRLGNTLNPEERFNKLLDFSELKDNADTQTFVNQLLMEMFETNPLVIASDNKLNTIKQQLRLPNKDKADGFVIFPKNEEDAEKYAKGNIPIVLNQILKGFDLWKRVNYAVTFDETKKVSRAFDANLDSVEDTQINEWRSNMNSIKNNTEIGKEIFPELKVANIERLNTKELLIYIDNIYNYLKKIGVNVSSDYIRYSLGNAEIKEDLFLFNLPEDSIFKISDLIEINKRITKKDVNIDDLFNTKGTENIESRLSKIAKGNSYFDERISDTSYKNMEGNMIFNYQNGTYHLKVVDTILKNIDKKENFQITIAPGVVLDRGEFIDENFLYKQADKFKTYIKKGLVFAFTGEGIRQSNSALTDESNRIIKKSKEFEGVSIGNMNDRDLAIYLLNIGEGINKTDDKVAFTPIFVGNYESSKTFEFVNLPFLTDLHDGKNITKKGLEFYKNEFKKEYNRILQFGELNGDKFEKYNTGELITIEYNNSNITVPIKDNKGIKKIDFSNFRAVAFSDNVRGLISEEFITLPSEIIIELEETINKENSDLKINRDLNNENNLLVNALLGNSFEDIKDIDENINNGLNILLDVYINKIENYGLIEVTRKLVNNVLTITKVTPLLISNTYNSTNDLKGFKQNNIIDNLKKKFLSDNLNTISFNQLMHGDQALLYKSDKVDMVKRFKGRNGATVSFKFLTIAPKLGIFKPWINLRFVVHSELESISGTTGKTIELADAQNYGSIEYFRKAMFAQGRLTENLARLIDKIEIGETITEEDNKMIFDQNLYLISLKTVGYDGATFLKKSDSLLSIDDVSEVIDATEADYNKNVKDSQFRIDATREIVKWSDGTYHEILETQPTLELHNRRKVMNGWRLYGDTWYYKGDNFKFDVSMPVSASKMLNRNVHKGKQDLTDVSEDSINLMDLDYYGLQVESSVPHDEITDPSTMFALALNELSKSNESFEVGGKLFDIKELTIAYQKNLHDRDKFSIDQKILEIENDDNLEQFRINMAESLIKTGGEKQLIEFVSKNIGDETNKQFINLNHPVVINKFISQLLSSFSKNVLAHKRAGDAAVHISSYGKNLVKEIVKYTIDDKDIYLWKEVPKNSVDYKNALKNELPDFSKSHNYFPDIDGNHTRHTNRLQDELKKLWKEGETVYFIDSLRHNVPVIKEGKIKGYFSETLLARHNIEQTEIFEGEKYMFSVRIPSQGRQSAVNVMWVGILPAYYGSVIVNAKEVMELSGHDYDVDKAFISKPEGYHENGKFIKYKETGKASEDFNQFVKYQTENNKQLKKLLKKKVKIEDALKQLSLPANPKEYVQYKKDYNLDTLNKGAINNFLLEANQMALATPYTLGKSGLYTSGTSMNRMKFGVLTENELNEIIQNKKESFQRTFNTEYDRLLLNSGWNFDNTIISTYDGDFRIEAKHENDLVNNIVEYLNKKFPNFSKPTSTEDFNNYSGGASGSDTYWDLIGREFGFNNHFHFREPLNYTDTKGVTSKGTENLDSKELQKSGIKPTYITQADYNEGAIKATKAFRMMLEGDENKNVRSAYIIRNWLQIKNADAVFALGTIKFSGETWVDAKKGSITAKIPIIKGGTGYAVQMAINEKKPIYVYDGTKDSWFKYDYNTKDFITTETPTLTKNYAGIGSRSLSTEEVWQKSIQAVKDVYQKTIDSFNNNINQQQTDNSEIKEGIDFVFSENPELANIGTKQEYSNYVATIFPESKVQDIVYHKTDAKFEKFNKAIKLEGYDQPVISFIDKNNLFRIDNFGNKTYSVILNSINPLITSTNYDELEKGQLNNNDSVIANGGEYGVFEPEQIHILGNQQDIQQFKEFVNSNKKENNNNGKEVSGKYLLSNDGKTFVNENKIPFNVHSILGHLISHRNNTVGKKNIGVDVNSTLLAAWLNRLNVGLRYSLEIGNNIYNELSETIILQDGSELRLYEVMDNLISSATDEAKEQLNARYGLTVDALNSLIPLLFMGGSFSLGIALVNQPIVQKFLSFKEKKNSAVLTQSELQLKEYSDIRLIQNMLSSEELSEYDKINENLDSDSDFLPERYNENYLASQLRNPNTSYSISDLQVLNDFISLGEISKEGNKLVSLIKVNGGLPSDIYEFDKLVANVNSLNEVSKTSKLNIAGALKDNHLALELTGKIKIINRLDKLFGKLILIKSKLFKRYKREFEYYTGDTLKDLDKELTSYLISQAYIKELEALPEDSKDKDLLKYLTTDIIDNNSETSIVKVFNNLLVNLKDSKAFENNALLNKLKPSLNENLATLSLNQLVKLTDMDMTDLIDSYTYMFGFSSQNGVSPNEFAKMLFAYYIVKDGWQFQYKGISKIFPVELFKRVSAVIDNISNGQFYELDEDSYIEEFKRRWFENIKRLALIPVVNIPMKTATESKFPEIKIFNDDKKSSQIYFTKGLPNEKLPYAFKDGKIPNYINVNNKIYRFANHSTTALYYEIGLEGTTNITSMSVKENPFMLDDQKILKNKQDNSKHFNSLLKFNKENIDVNDNKDLQSNKIEEDFIVKIDHYNYNYNPNTKEVVRNAKTGDIIESNETQINKVLVKYALSVDSLTKVYNGAEYVKINGKVLNITNSNEVTQPQILYLFENHIVSQTPIIFQSLNFRKKEKIIIIPKGSLSTNDIIFEDKENIYLMNNQQQEAFNKIKKVIDNYYSIEYNSQGESINFENDYLQKLYGGKISKSLFNNMYGIQGSGGVGKTTLAKAISEYFQKKHYNKSLVFSSPTHKAATVLQESLGKDSEKVDEGNVFTNASLVGSMKEDSNEFLLSNDFDYFKRRKPQIGNNVDFIIFDESSMVDINYVQAIEKRIKGSDNKKIPMMLFLGDMKQLPPILKDTQLFNRGFISMSILANKNKSTKLTQIMRSSDEFFVNIFNSIGNQIEENIYNQLEGKIPIPYNYILLKKLLNSSQGNLTVYNNKDSISEVYAKVLFDNLNPKSGYYSHYNKLNNTVTIDLEKRIRKAYMEKIYGTTDHLSTKISFVQVNEYLNKFGAKTLLNDEGISNIDNLSEVLQFIEIENIRSFIFGDYVQAPSDISINSSELIIDKDKLNSFAQKVINNLDENVNSGFSNTVDGKIIFNGEGSFKPSSRYRVLDIIQEKSNILDIVENAKNILRYTNMGAVLNTKILVENNNVGIYVKNKDLILENILLYTRQNRIRVNSYFMNTYSNYEFISDGKNDKGKHINPRQVYTLKEGGTINKGNDNIILKLVVPYNYSFESDYSKTLNLLGKNVSNFEAKGDIYSQNHFSKSYLGSSHTTQGDSFTEIFAGVSNVLGQKMAGADDIASSIYTILTRSMSKISVLNESATFINDLLETEGDTKFNQNLNC